ncbi:hypothetical protein SUGI_0590450 [Cryptomeria japonica]|uniref:sugar transport protein 7-like n=1 Tax=Cryptomeria japonica TaxID=3369 RepID=UPI0024146C0D|nr:sugar transport protein 7-like [Cryptomeria japonica]GLJ29871.1 hypothetical protein SUGI_0590450 [Cryptomeria japonica]
MVVGIVLLICLFTVAFGWSWGPLGWLVPSELFPLETHSAGQAMVVSMNLLFTAIIAQLFLVLLCNLNYGIFLLFASPVFLMSVFIFLVLPETKGIPIKETRFEWEKHWYWKRIIKDDDDQAKYMESNNGVNKGF